MSMTYVWVKDAYEMRWMFLCEEDGDKKTYKVVKGFSA